MSSRRRGLQDFEGRITHANYTITYRGSNPEKKLPKRVRDTQKAWAAVQAQSVQSRRKTMTPTPRQSPARYLPPSHQHLFQSVLVGDFAWMPGFRCLSEGPLICLWRSYSGNISYFPPFLLSERKEERKEQQLWLVWGWHERLIFMQRCKCLSATQWQVLWQCHASIQNNRHASQRPGRSHSACSR